MTLTSHTLIVVLVLGCVGTGRAQDMPLSQVLFDDQPWELVGEGYGFTEGPAVDAHGNVFFSDPRNNRIYRIDAKDGAVRLFAEDTRKVSGMMFGPDGRLYACSRNARQIVTYDADAQRSTIADVPDCNDLVVTSSGDIYFTDPGGQRVWFIPAGGDKRLVADGFRPNGIILWPAEGTLVVTDRTQPHLWTFRIEADGSLAYRDRYYMPLQMPFGVERPGSDGMTVDRDGRLYVATFAGLQMFDPTGRLGGTIARPQQKFLSNVCFGGSDLTTLYVTCSDKVYRRKTKATGTPYFHRAKADPSK